MKIVSLLIAVILSSCMHYYEGADPAARDGQAEAVEFIKYAIVNRTEMSKSLLKTNFKIYWVDDICPEGNIPEYANGWTAVVIGNQCYGGYMWDCDHIYVARRETFSKSSLAHEMGHCLLERQGVTADARHWYSYFWNDIIPAINKDLGELGL